MRKFCLILLCFVISLLVLKPIVIQATDESKVYNLVLDVNPLLAKEKTKITVEWDMMKELKELVVMTRLTNGQEEISFIYSPTNGRDNIGEFIESTNNNGILPYHYYLDFEMNINKTGNFELVFEYKVGNEWYEYTNYIYTDSKIVEENTFSTKNAIIVGIIITIFASAASYLILEASRKDFAITDDDDSN